MRPVPCLLPCLRPCPGPARTRSRGVAAIEFALLLTLMVSLVAGILEFGRTFWYYDALSKATRNGARAVSSSAKATLSVGAANARDMVLLDLTSAGVPGLDADNIDVVCLYASNVESTCADATTPLGVRVSITGFTMTLGNMVPFMLSSSSSYTVGLTPSTTMPYMK
jgi:Flp pilus assembly protein TadG